MDIIDTGADHVLGIRIDGKIEGGDFDALTAAVEDKLARHEKIAIYVEMEEFAGLSLEALWKDLRLAFKHLARFSKKAVVSDKVWAERLASAAARFVPVIEVRHFTPDQRAEARDWAAS